VKTLAVAVLAAVSLAVPTAPARAAQKPLRWVALGDSYTAGAVPAAGEEYEQPRDGCGRTDHSYPQVIKAALGSRVALKNVSCGGATIASIDHTAQTPSGHHFPPLSKDPDYPFSKVPLQVKAVSPATDVITVGIGGNSLGFGEIVKKCVELGLKALGQGAPCKAHYGDQLKGRLDKVGAEYADMLTALRRAAPRARIITVGYPHLVPEDTSKCIPGSLFGFGTVTRDDLAWLRVTALEPLNAMIRARTAQQHGQYVDVYTSSKGHSVCDKLGGNNWVEGILDTSGRFALVHPNTKGHANVAALVQKAILGV
jgi:lysophospholipase L1-like esterase